MIGRVRKYLFYQKASETIQLCPDLYLNVQRLRHRGRPAYHRIVSPGHKMMIEGFPRSGTSFAVRAMVEANPDLLDRVATHIHTSAHLRAAVQFSVPGMVVIREPSSAVTSMIALGNQTGRMRLDGMCDADKAALIGQATRRYSAFHRALFGLEDHLMIVRFERVTTDFGQVIHAFNLRFGTTFKRFDHTEEAASQILRSGKIHIGPNADRNLEKRSLARLYWAPTNAADRRAAEEAYRQCVEVADTMDGTQCSLQ